MSHLMISVAGIRGIVGDSIKPEEFVRFVLAFAEGCKPRSVVVGGDTRPSREMVRHLVFGALEAAGCDILDLGICPTPTIGLMTRLKKAGGGIAITASHNPVEWNALKFFRSDGTFMTADDNRVLMERYQAGQFHLAPAAKLGRLTACADPAGEHIKRALSFVNAAAIRRAKIKVALDCCQGAGAQVLPQLLERLGCDTRVIFDKQDGTFPRHAEPLPEHLGALSQAVKRHGTAVGFAVDPDADRLALVDETGRAIGEERTIVLVANHLLNRFRSSVTVNLSTTRAVEDVCKAHGVACHRTKIGEAHVVSGMKKHRSRIGGEGNGGVILSDVHFGRDSLGGIAVILEALALNRSALSGLNARVPDYVIVKDKLPIGGLRIEAIYRKITAIFGSKSRINTDDGLRLDFGQAWIHLRPSGTEPIFRVFVEAPAMDEAQALVQRAREIVRP
ncbi:MAG: phosphoglucosamine mutase [Candidatus Sumerlaeota bacterium]|nr:phosphoglucosamine mutase [Candidatus Sumerlaeota bacterium]